jgi:hypothetical protein
MKVFTLTPNLWAEAKALWKLASRGAKCVLVLYASYIPSASRRVGKKIPILRLLFRKGAPPAGSSMGSEHGGRPI